MNYEHLLTNILHPSDKRSQRAHGIMQKPNGFLEHLLTNILHPSDKRSILISQRAHGLVIIDVQKPNGFLCE